ncbi:MAG: hypothetical protein NC123_00390 [Butyrivibrio sp.]|nr:hypothetical protein [Acetatifactor muris]MCM1557993.1 hypothetical protein [Butyrivibrio sp.]
MIKNEWIKLFRNRVFLIFFAAIFAFYGFYLYWSLVIYVKSGVAEQAPASYYQELTKELEALSLTDEEKLELLTERRKQMEELEGTMMSGRFGLTQLVYEEVWDEISRGLRYQEIRTAVVSSADKQLKKLDRGNYGRLQRRYLESSLEKTKEVYGRLTDVAAVSAYARGLEALTDNPVADICCLFIVLLAVFELVTVERQNERIILSKSTVRGRKVHAFVKAAVLGGLCMLVTVLLLLEGLLVIGRIYPIPSPAVPVQSVYPYCALKISIGGFLCLYTLLKILFCFLCTAFAYAVCCILRQVVPILLVILGVGGAFVFLYLGIPETSYLAPLRDVSPVALGQAGELLERYRCVNIFGLAVNRAGFAAVLLCAGTAALLAAAVKLYMTAEETNILADRHSVYDRKQRWSVNLFCHECYKTFLSQKLILVLALAAVVSVPYLKLTNAEGGDTLTDYLYRMYSSSVAGEYTAEIPDYISRKQEEVLSAMQRPEVQEREKMVYETMLEALSRMSGYAGYLSTRENSYYLNNNAYIALTGGNESVNRNTLMTYILMYGFAIVCFVLTMSIDYQRGENRIIHSTEKGRRQYVKIKVFIGMLISLVLLVLFWAPTLCSRLAAEGVEYIFAPACSLQHLSWAGGEISLFGYLCLLYGARYLSLLGVMAFSYLMERKVKSSITAIVCVCAVVEIPLAVMLILH